MLPMAVQHTSFRAPNHSSSEDNFTNSTEETSVQPQTEMHHVRKISHILTRYREENIDCWILQMAAMNRRKKNFM